MMALSKVFYRQVKRGFITVEEINVPKIKKEVLELLEMEKEDGYYLG